jgi:hypothetical protein
VVADLQALPFRDNSVAAVECDAVLEHPGTLYWRCQRWCACCVRVRTSTLWSRSINHFILIPATTTAGRFPAWRNY